MKQIILSSLLLISVISQAQSYLIPGPSHGTGQQINSQPNNSSSNLQFYGFDQFRQSEQEAIFQQNLYDQARSGSWEEKTAQQNRDRAIETGLYVIKSINTFYGMQYTQIETITNELNQKYRQARAGSAMERFYNQSQISSINALSNELNRVIQSIQNSDLLIKFGHENKQKYNQAQSGSKLEATYNLAYKNSFQKLPNLVSFENNNRRNFKDIEFVATTFHSLYSQARAGSAEESAYSVTRNNSLSQAHQLFKNQIQYMQRFELQNIQAEYDQKYRQAPAGSQLEQYYRSIRDLARSHIR